MKNKILSYLLGGFLAILPWFIAGNVQADCDCPDGDLSCQKSCYYESQEYKDNNTTEKKCNGIKLNTDFPIIGNCIGTKDTNPTQVFPSMISALIKITMSFIFVACLIIIIVAGIIWASAGDNTTKTNTAKGLIIKVATTILLLGFSGVILRLINPNFFS